MNAYIRFAPALLAAATLSACMDPPPEFGAFPVADDDVTAEVSREVATETAEVALLGINAASYELWSHRWDESMLDAIGPGDWLPYVDPLKAEYGEYIGIDETRLTAASAPGAVRFSFLAEFEKGYLMLVHVYPADGDTIIGAHLRDAFTGQIPESLR